MNLRHCLRALAGACLLLASATSPAALKPLTTTKQAARAVASSMLLREDAQNAAFEFMYTTRDIVARQMSAFAAVTTFQSLLLTPGGLVLNCPIAGTVTARLSKAKPRVLTLDWRQCAREEYSTRRVQDGPAEVVLLEDSLTPTAVASIRLGDRNRDHIETSQYDFSVEGPQDLRYRNLRLTGYLPLQRLGDNNIFAGRYLSQLTGFARIVSYLPDFGTVPQSDERYRYEFLLSTSGALLTGESTYVDGNTYGEEVSIITGDFAQRYDEVAMPSNGGPRTVGKSYGGTGLRVTWGMNGALARGYFSIDGVARMDYNQWWGFGCAKPDEFSYRTRTLLEYMTGDYTGHMFDSGKLSINGNSTATFTTSGTLFVDRVGHVALTVPGAAPVSYDVNGFIYGSELTVAGYCTP